MVIRENGNIETKSDKYKKDEIPPLENYSDVVMFRLRRMINSNKGRNISC